MRPSRHQAPWAIALLLLTACALPEDAKVPQTEAPGDGARLAPTSMPELASRSHACGQRRGSGHWWTDGALGDKPGNGPWCQDTGDTGAPAAWAPFRRLEPPSPIRDDLRGWGIVIADMNQDGRNDLYINHHIGMPTLLLTDPDGALLPTAIPGLTDLTADRHGAIVVDADDDGLKELIQTTGGDSPTQLFRIFPDGTGEDAVELLNADRPAPRGYRMFYADVSRDGVSDLFHNTLPPNRPEQDPSIHFIGAWDDSVMPPTIEYVPTEGWQGYVPARAQRLPSLLDLDGDGRMALLELPVGGRNVGEPVWPLWPGDEATGANYPDFDYGITGVRTGDLDGDGDEDMILLYRPEWTTQDIDRVDDHTIRFASITSTDIPNEVLVHTAGDLTVQVETATRGTIAPFEVAGVRYDQDVITVSADLPLGRPDLPEPDASGNIPAADRAVHIWREADGWHVAPQQRNAYIGVTLHGEDAPIVDWSLLTPPRPDPRVSRSRVWRMNAEAGVYERWPDSPLEQDGCHAAVIADVDNDGDQDVYLGCSNNALNFPNQLWLNDGDGGFSRFEDDPTGDLAGPSIGHVSCMEVGDMDDDGDLDIVVDVGFGAHFLSPATYILGNELADGHWLRLDLEGPAGLPSPVGAIVDVKAAGKWQRFLYRGGQNGDCQSEATLHVGLGNARHAQEVRVAYPTGEIFELKHVAADQVLTIAP